MKKQPLFPFEERFFIWFDPPPDAWYKSYVMKSDIHPTYYPDAKVKCACGNHFTVGATAPEITVEVCAHCHPFFTGKAKMVDTAGKVERFKERMSRKTELGTARGGKKNKLAKREARRQAAKSADKE